MRDGPDIARVAALIGEPARAVILEALLSGRALTATELAREAGVTAPTVSAHLAKLAEGGLIVMRKQGRHRYAALAGPDVATLLESLSLFSAGKGNLRTRPGPRDEAMRTARICYNHLAGARAVQLYDSMVMRGFLSVDGDALGLTAGGAAFVDALGVSVEAGRSRAPLCRQCLDWSERRSHLAGRLGRALLTHFEAAGWVRRSAGSRVVTFTPPGLRAFDQHFPLEGAGGSAR